jgi:hypothetical protein
MESRITAWAPVVGQSPVGFQQESNSFGIVQGNGSE